MLSLCGACFSVAVVVVVSPLGTKDMHENPVENRPTTQWLTSHPVSIPASGYCRSSVY